MAQGIFLAAPIFSDVDDLRVEFIIKLSIAREVALEKAADFLVGSFFRDVPVALENSSRVGVDDEHAMLAGVEQDGVGCLGANSVHGQKFFAKLRGWRAKHARERAAIFFSQKLYKRFQLFCFLPEVSRGTNQARQPGLGHSFDCGNGEHLFAAQIYDDLFDVPPGGVLGKDGANDDFERSFGGPPLQWATRSEHGIVIFRQCGGVIDNVFRGKDFRGRDFRPASTQIVGTLAWSHRKHLYGKIARAKRQVKISL